MRHYAKVFALAAIVLLIGLGARPEQAFSEPGPDESKPRFVPDRVLVELREDAPADTVDAINRKNGARTEKKIPRTRVSVVKLPKGLQVADAVKRYEASQDVEYAEPDYLLTPAQTAPKTPNDPEYRKMWNLNNTGQTVGTADVDVDAPEAWGSTTGGAGAVVAVIDTGADVNHPDLRDNVWTNPDEVAGNGVDDDRNGYVDDVHGWDFRNEDNSVSDSTADDGHGTHVAGTIAAEGNNGLGVTGISWQAKIVPLKFMSASGGSTSDAVEAINYAVAEGVKISNNSWGGGGFSQTLLDAIKNADAAGHLMVAAAMNGGSDGIGDNNDATPIYPASYDSPNVVSVAASDHKDALTAFSNYGATSVDLAAPGLDVLSTTPGGAYGYGSGTSMAAPHVTGVAALVKSKFPELDDAGIKDRILRSAEARPAFKGKTVTGGRLNAARALGIQLTEISLNASLATVSYGAATTLSGRLTSYGASLPGKPVILEQRPVGASAFTTLRQGTTDANGNVSFAGVKPAKNTDYRMRFAGSSAPSLEPSFSVARRVNAMALVSLSTATTNLKLGRSRTISGSVAPNHAGYAVVAKVYRNGSLVTQKSLRLNSNSGYSYAYKPSSTGSYAVQVSFAGHADHLGNVSVRKSFKVVR